MFHRTSILFAAASAAAVAAPAHASPWITGELPAAFAVSTPQDSFFAAGAMPSIAGFVPFASHTSFGLRMRFGALGNASDHAANEVDPGKGGLIAAMLALRFDLSNTWLEVDGGGGMTGTDAVPTVEVGIGHDFDFGGYAVGPAVRYLRVIGGGAMPMIDQGSAGIVLVGLEVRTRSRPRQVRIVTDVVQAPPPRPEVDHDRIAIVDRGCMSDAPGSPGCPPPDRDGDGIPDAVDECPDEAEVVNGVQDADGCPDEGLFQVHDDRIVLDERVLFDVNRARIKHSGRRVITAIADAWRAHPEWGHMVVEGHADVRGPATFNDWLSQTRASHVREALIGAGVPADRIGSVGYGATRPRDPGFSEAAHQRNRRVEFVIVRDGGQQ